MVKIVRYIALFFCIDIIVLLGIYFGILCVFNIFLTKYIFLRVLRVSFFVVFWCIKRL